ncbi:hypothetical protein YC2023_022899 [Brassica napus]
MSPRSSDIIKSNGEDIGFVKEPYYTKTSNKLKPREAVKKNLSTTTQTTMAGGTRIDADTLEFFGGRQRLFPLLSSSLPTNALLPSFSKIRMVPVAVDLVRDISNVQRK